MRQDAPNAGAHHTARLEEKPATEHGGSARTVTPYWNSAHWLTNLSHWARYTCTRGDSTGVLAAAAGAGGRADTEGASACTACALHAWLGAMILSARLPGPAHPRTSPPCAHMEAANDVLLHRAVLHLLAVDRPVEGGAACLDARLVAAGHRRHGWRCVRLPNCLQLSIAGVV